jgi:dienelactone hydrolase
VHGPDAGDVTGIAQAAAGALLIVAAAVCAWRSRRLDERPARRYARRTLVGVAAFLVLYEVVYPVALAGVATQRVRWTVPEARLGGPALPVRLRASDGIALAGWYVPSRNGAVIVVSPGRSDEVQAHVRMLTRHGYGALVFDRRGEGASQGDPNVLGWSGERDLRAAVAWLAARPDVHDGRIGGLGLSVGGEMLLQTAAHDRALRAVASEGAGRRSIREQRHMPGVARWQLAPQMAVLTAATAVAADDAPPPDLAALVGRIAPRPVLLVHARHGLVDEVLNREYVARAGEPKAIWEVARGGHTDALAAEPREYERRIVGFFDRALPAGR